MQPSSRLVWMNGEFFSESDAKISIYDSALMFGDMVFEMTRSFGGKQFLLEEHIHRLYTGLKILEIPMELTQLELKQICELVVERNSSAFDRQDEHRLMIDVTRGALGIYKGVEGIHSGTNVIIADFPLKWTVASMGPLFDLGINLVIPSQRNLTSQEIDPKIKNRSRLHYLRANLEVSRMQGERNWAVLLDRDGFVTEGTGDNVFLVKDGVVYTPEGRNILRGISRDYVMNTLCPELQIEVVEKNLEPYDFYDADECFITATPFCMLPVTSFQYQKIAGGRVGIIFSKLLERWGQNVGIDIKRQIQSWYRGQDNGTSPYQFKR
jgi:branched-chain amino acid aminotransferase